MKNFKKNLNEFYDDADRTAKQIKNCANEMLDDFYIELEKYSNTNNQAHLKHAQDAYKRIKAVRAYIKSV